MAHEHIYQELGETTDAQISFTVAYSGKYYVKTNLDLKGRGIRPNGEAPNGKKTYYVTDVALEKLKTQYSTSFLADL